MSLILAFAFFPLLAAEAPPVNWVARTEARIDSPPSGTTGVLTRVLQIDVGATAGINQGDWHLVAAYQPRLLANAPDAAGKTLLNLLNNGRLEADYLVSRTQKLSIGQTVSYGRQDFSPLTGAATGALPPTPQPGSRVPSLELLAVFSSVSSLSYTRSFTRRLAFSATAAFQTSGGADQTARSFLLQQRGVPADARLSWQISRSDRLAVGLGGSTFAFSNGSRTTITKASGTWATDLGPALSANLGFGGGTTQTNAPGAPTTVQLTYLASAGVTSRLNFGRQTLTETVTGSVNTVTDPLNGAPYRLGTMVGTIGYEPVNLFRLNASASVGRALSGATEMGQTLTRLEVATTWQAAREVGLTLGARLASQSGGSAQAIPNATQWAGYAAVTYVPAFAAAR